MLRSVLFVGVAAAIYYLKGFAPSSSDDMASFNAAVSEGMNNISSEQASLSRVVSEMVNSADFRAAQLNVSTEVMLSDIAAAGDAARLQLEQMGGITQDLNQLHNRVDNVDNRMTVLLKGIVYLVSLRWAFSNTNSSLHVSGSEVVNEVLSLERPFSFDSVRSTEAATQIVVETNSIHTQTDDMDFDRIIELINPYIALYGVRRVLWRLRSILPVISDSIEDADSETTQSSSTPPSPDLAVLHTTESMESPDYATPHRLEMHSSEEPDLDLSNSYSASSLAPQSEEITPQSSGFTPQSEEITPQDRILVCDNPTFQPSTPISQSPDETNPYQIHRHNFFCLRVGRHLPCFLQLLDRIGI